MLRVTRRHALFYFLPLMILCPWRKDAGTTSNMVFWPSLRKGGLSIMSKSILFDIALYLYFLVRQ